MTDHRILKNDGMPIELCERKSRHGALKIHYLEGIPLLVGDALEVWSEGRWWPIEYLQEWTDDASTILFRNVAMEAQHLPATALFRWPDEEATRLRMIQQRENRRRLRE